MVRTPDMDVKREVLRKIAAWCREYNVDFDETKPLLTITDGDVNGFELVYYVRAVDRNTVTISAPYLLNPLTPTMKDRANRDTWWQQILARSNGNHYKVEEYTIGTKETSTEEWVAIHLNFHLTGDNDRDEGRWFRITGDVQEAYTWIEDDLDRAEELGLRFQ